MLLSPLTPAGEARLAVPLARASVRRPARPCCWARWRCWPPWPCCRLARDASRAAARRPRAAAAGIGRAGGGQGRSGGGLAGQRADRDPAGAGARQRRAAGRDGAARHGDGCRRAVRNGGLRRQPGAPGGPRPRCTARRSRRTSPRTGRPESASVGHRPAADQPAPRPGDQADNPGRRGADRRQWPARAHARGDRRCAGAALVSTVDGRRPRGDREIMLGAATMRATGPGWEERSG